MTDWYCFHNNNYNCKLSSLPPFLKKLVVCGISFQIHSSHWNFIFSMQRVRDTSLSFAVSSQLPSIICTVTKWSTINKTCGHRPCLWCLSLAVVADMRDMREIPGSGEDPSDYIQGTNQVFCFENNSKRFFSWTSFFKVELNFGTLEFAPSY